MRKVKTTLDALRKEGLSDQMYKQLLSTKVFGCFAVGGENFLSKARLLLLYLTKQGANIAAHRLRHWALMSQDLCTKPGSMLLKVLLNGLKKHEKEIAKQNDYTSQTSLSTS